VTVRHFTPGELTSMRAVQESAMQDTCVVQTAGSGAKDEYGYPAQAWVDGQPVACGFGQQSRREFMGQAQVGEKSLTLRIPSGTAVTRLDRIKITHRLGVALPVPEIYEIVGEPHSGPTGMLLNLRRVDK
jgi:hypothetical protein